MVLGCGIAGEKVTPLLAARVDRGIALLRCNPKAVLIMSGGQGPGEKIPESEAMADYAIEQEWTPTGSSRSRDPYLRRKICSFPGN